MLNDFETILVKHARILAARLEQKRDDGQTTRNEDSAYITISALLDVIDKYLGGLQ